MKELYDVWFSSLDLEHKTKLDLLKKYTSQEIWELGEKDFWKNKIQKHEIAQILNSKSLEEPKRNLEYMQKKNIKLISIQDEKYPQKLHQIDNQPAFLYVRGQEEILDEDSVRNCWLQNGEP